MLYDMFYGFYAPPTLCRASMRGCAMCDAPVLGFGTPGIMLIMIMDYGLYPWVKSPITIYDRPSKNSQKGC